MFKTFIFININVVKNRNFYNYFNKYRNFKFKNSYITSEIGS